MRFIAGPINDQLLVNLVDEMILECTRVRAAVAYANYNNMILFQACADNLKPLEFYGRYDHTVPVSPEILKWFLDQRSPNLECKLVPEILHSKIIWWVDSGAYIGSANLSDRAWISNIEGGMFLDQDDLVEFGIDVELEAFFDEVDERSNPLTKEIYEEQVELAREKRELSKQETKLKNKFNKRRKLPIGKGLTHYEVNKRSPDRGFNDFEQEWNATLQDMRNIASRISAPEGRPDWISDEVPPGVQADQFLHAYYYNLVKEGNSHPYEKFYQENYENPEKALSEVIRWWKKADFNHDFESNTIYVWAPRLKELFAEDRILDLTEEEFVEAVSMVHAVRDYGTKQKNTYLNLPDSPQKAEDKITRFAHLLWEKRSRTGKTPLETIHHVVWGRGDVSRRIWEGLHYKEWRIPQIGLSTLGEIVGWARPDDYPPRNMRTSKGLRALGYNVRI